jgi:hypothetical protein
MRVGVVPLQLYEYEVEPSTTHAPYVAGTVTYVSTLPEQVVDAE